MMGVGQAQKTMDAIYRIIETYTMDQAGIGRRYVQQANGSLEWLPVPTPPLEIYDLWDYLRALTKK